MNIQIRYGLNVVSRDFPAGISVGQVLRDGNVKAGLGYSDNVRALVNGVEMPTDAILQPETTLVVEARVNQKAQDSQTITVRYGLNSITRVMPYGSTVGQVVGDRNIKAALGYSDNVRVLLNGVELPNDAVAPNAATLVIEARVNQKAS